MRKPVQIAIFLFLAAFAVGCSKQSRRTLPEIPTNGNAGARERFQQARTSFEQDESNPDASTREEFEAIAREYPSDPIAPFARLYAGIAAVKSGDYSAALKNLDPPEQAIDPKVDARRRLYRGVALVRVGRSAEAAPDLQAGKSAVTDDTERVLWHASSAESFAATGDPAQAITHYDAWHAAATAAEAAYCLDRIQLLAASLSDVTATQVYNRVKDDEGPAAAIVGARVAAVLATRGNASQAESVRNDISEIRKKLGLDELFAGGKGGRSDRVGAVIPLSGRRARVGDLAQRGLAMAAGTFGSPAVGGSAFSLTAVDSRSSGTGAAKAIDELIADGAIAAVGPVDAKSVDRAARRAAASGLALLTLDPRGLSGQGQRSVFHIMHSAEDRARALARHAVKNGIKDFAILGPKSGYGSAVGAAFRREVTRLGGRVLAEAWYSPKETNFGKAIRKLRKPWKAVFIPDMASRLELVAPALAVANFRSRPIGSKRRRGRSIVLLSTAEALGERFLRSAGRYVNGAVFAPGFVADASDSRIGQFSRRYRDAFGRAPTSLEAYAYDAVSVIRSAVAAGARSRGELVRFVSSSETAGLTGTISFDGGGRRRDNGILYEVVSADSGNRTMRAVRE